MRPAPCLFFFCAFAALSVAAQESKPWLESQGLEAASWKSFQEFEAVVARIPNAKDPPGPQERLIVFRQGKPVLQVTDKDGIEAAS